MTTEAYPWIGLVHGENDDVEQEEEDEEDELIKARVSTETRNRKIEELREAVIDLWAHIREKDKLLSDMMAKLIAYEKTAAILVERTADPEEQSDVACSRVCAVPW